MKQYFVFGILFGAWALISTQSASTGDLTDVSNTTENNSTFSNSSTSSNSTILQFFEIDNSSFPDTGNNSTNGNQIVQPSDNNDSPNGFGALFNLFENVINQNIDSDPDQSPIPKPDPIDEFWSNLLKPPPTTEDPLDKLWANLLESSTLPSDDDIEKMLASGRFPWFNLFSANHPFRKRLDKIFQSLFRPFAPRPMPRP